MGNSKYKYKINKEAVTRFFLDETPSEESLKAVRLVILTVLIKHYAKYISLRDDLIGECLVKLFKIKDNYDPSFSAYSYVYTACRNEIGNFINKRKEVIVEDILPISNASSTFSAVSLPAEINKFKDYLTGEKDFTIIELTSRDAINLAVFTELNLPTRKLTPPEFISSNPNSVNTLYKILIKL